MDLLEVVAGGGGLWVKGAGGGYKSSSEESSDESKIDLNLILAAWHFLNPSLSLVKLRSREESSLSESKSLLGLRSYLGSLKSMTSVSSEDSGLVSLLGCLRSYLGSQRSMTSFSSQVSVLVGGGLSCPEEENSGQ